ncbi:MAG: hypothetical protein PHC34_09525 [Candidatus Gastranaerophilales bacterium]|nr:hypothetical protein [Candidatus Gastranaerophilales bacterium]
MLVNTFTPYSPAFGQKQPLRLGYDIRLIARQVKQGKLKLEDVQTAIEAELKKSDIGNTRKGDLQGLKQMLGIKD